ncbi:SDR family NAD(P)-dependent oxidoreductase [Paraburkholderia hospita]|uniref:SDR family NAD(P)-dependent oxidoreductase n=1 Tax=Paraburkholderia hospita TaxID=169430 RepID=UPI0009A5DF3D|nr:glucose 1-dehydrogenase [Paraburkholderia hospita]SKC93381.1 NAD(P)-dependent dehydrogenase, short-chain alcohol dehydrogenase family [Paraburkholderia hospita]
MNRLLDGKVVIVTGAARGIGRAAALAVAKAGASVALTDRDEAAVLEAANEIVSLGGSAIAIPGNVAHEADVARVVGATVERYGRLDGAFNNAGVEQRNTPLHELSEEQWDFVININLKGVFFCMKHQIAAMLPSGGGSIVNASSSLGRVGIPNASEYCASKGGVLGLTKGAALDYGMNNIRVNAVLPGVIRTPMIESLISQPQFSALLPALEARHPIGRLGMPSEVADAVVWLLSDSSSFVHGAEIAVDGGYLAI